jgi:hypothetical protein
MTCNNKIGKKIEQPALDSDNMRNLIGDILINGYKIQMRRKRKKIPVNKLYGLTGFHNSNNKGFPIKTKIYYDLENSAKVMELLPKTKSEVEAIKKRDPKLTYQTIMPIMEKYKEEYVLSLVIKIIFATCFFLWGIEFIKSEEGEDLGSNIWSKPSLEKAIELASDEPHAEILIDENGKKTVIEAYDNRPNHTIHLFCDEEAAYGLINLFGGIESLSVISSKSTSFTYKKLKGKGIFFLIDTQKNKFQQLSEEEYLSIKEV